MHTNTILNKMEGHSNGIDVTIEASHTTGNYITVQVTKTNL